MKHLIFFALLFPAFASAKISHELWGNLGTNEKFQLVSEYRKTISELEEKQAQAGLQSSFEFIIQKAWAEDELNCLYAGWPSQRVNGSCKSPAKVASSKYDAGKCAAGEIQCQPLLFGNDLCVNQSTKKSKQSVFSNCDKKFAKEKRNLKEVIDELISQGREKDLLSLFEFVDKVCSSGAQSKTPMCRRLEKKVKAMKELFTPTPADVVTQAQKKLDAVTGNPPQSAGVVECDPKAEAPAKSEVAAASPPAPTQISEVSAPVPSSASTQILGVNPPFERDRIRNPDSCTTITREFVVATKCVPPEEVFAGYTFKNLDKEAKFGRIINFEAIDSARDGTAIYLSDSVSTWDSHNPKSTIVLLPRRGLPTSVQNGDEVTVTLTTGEAVVMSASTKKVLRGVLTEGPLQALQSTEKDLGFSSRSPSNVQYSGSGISIRVDHMNRSPSESSFGHTKAEVRQGNRLCKILKTKIWNSSGRLIPESDQSFLDLINSECPPKKGETLFKL